MSNVLLQASLEVAVPLWIQRLEAGGGPSAADYEAARAFATELASHGDELLYRGKKPGRAKELFNSMAHSLAVLAFCPGGVTLFGVHWEARGAPDAAA